MDCRDILNRIEQGALADLTRDDLTAGAEAVLSVSAKTAPVLAVVVARLRAEYITDTVEWIGYCKVTFGLEGSYLHHLHKIGRMLLNVTCDTRLYGKLFFLDTDKLLAISQIPSEKIDAFVKLQTKQLSRMTRAEVRAAVALFLDPDGVHAAPEQPDLPMFAELLTSADAFDDEDFIKVCDTPEKAVRSMELGIGFLSGALEYNRAPEHRDTVRLAALKSVLLAQIAEIEKALTEE